MAASQYDVRFILSMQDRTGNSLRRFAGDMTKTTAEAKRMKKAMAAMDVGRGLVIRGLLAGAGLAATAQQASTFATSVSKAATQIAGNNSTQQIAKNSITLQQKLLDLMREFPASAQEQASAAYDIFSAMNVPLKQGVALLKLFNMVAVAGATDLATASDAMITILNNFGGTWQRNLKIVNTSFAIIRFGKMEFADFNNMLQSVVPAAKGAGQGLEDVAGAMAFLSTRMKPNIAATALSRLLEVMSRGDFKRGAERLKLNFTELDGSLRPFPELIHELAKLPVSRIKGTINQLIPLVTAVGRGSGKGIQSTVFSRRALVQMVQDEKKFQTFQTNVLGATDEFRKRYETMIGTTGVRWERFKASLQATAIIVGAAVIPYFERLGDVISKGIDWARQNQGTIKWIAVATFAVATASLLAGTFLKLYGAAMILVPMLWNVGKAMVGIQIAGRASAAIGFLAAAFSLLRSNGLKALPVIFMMNGGLKTLLTRLALLTKIGIIVTTIVFLWEMRKNKGWQEFWKGVDDKLLGGVKKFRNWGSAEKAIGYPIQKILELDHKTRVQNLEKIAANAKKGKGSNDDIAKQVTSNYKKLIAQIKRDIGKVGGSLFDEKMMKKLGLDPQSIQDQINQLLYPEDDKGGQGAANLAKEIAARTKELLDQATSKLVEVYQGFKDANTQAFGEIFKGPQAEGEEAQLRKQWNWTTTGENILSDLKAQVRQFRKWRNSLNELIKRGAPLEMVKQIQAQGPAAQKMIDALLTGGKSTAKGLGIMGRKPAFVLSGKHKGLIQEGNLDIMNRKVAHLGKGVVATVRSITVGMDGAFKVLPTIIDGKALKGTPKEIAAQAVAHYRKTGENLGTFSSEAAANAYAESLHEQQAKLKSPTDAFFQEYVNTWKTGQKLITNATNTDFNAQLNKWNKFGKQTGFKIILGLESEEQNVQKRMTGVVERLYGHIAKVIAEQQVKLEMSVPDAKVTFDYSGLAADPNDTSTGQHPKPKPKYPHGKPPPEKSPGNIPFWWREDQAAGLPGRTGAVDWSKAVHHVSPQTGQTVVFNVNGVFMTEQEMMNAALFQAKHKLKHTR